MGPRPLRSAVSGYLCLDIRLRGIRVCGINLTLGLGNRARRCTPDGDLPASAALPNNGGMRPALMRGNGTVYRQKGSRFWWIQYYRDGKAERESSKSAKHKVAADLLKTRLVEVLQQPLFDPASERLRIRDLAAAIFLDYRMNQRASLRELRSRWKQHLEPFFGELQAQRVDSDCVSRYVVARQAAGAANATINRELAVLKRIYKLAVKSRKLRLGACPYIAMLPEKNVRKGFVKEAEYQALATATAVVGLWLRAMFELGYTYGWRRGELVKMRVSQVDLAERTIVLHPDETKNDEARLVKMTGKVFELLRECVAGKQPDDPVFTRMIDARGRRSKVKGRVVDFRRAWAQACCAAGRGRMVCPKCNTPVSPPCDTAVSHGERDKNGFAVRQSSVARRAPNSGGPCDKNSEKPCDRALSLEAKAFEVEAKEKLEAKGEGGKIGSAPQIFPCLSCGSSWRAKQLKFAGLLFHDLRRSGIRNMRRHGISEKVAMTIAGQKTRSVFERYNIVDESDLDDAVLKLEDATRRRRQLDMFGETGNLFEEPEAANPEPIDSMKTDAAAPKKPPENEAENQHRTAIAGQKPAQSRFN